MGSESAPSNSKRGLFETPIIIGVRKSHWRSQIWDKLPKQIQPSFYGCINVPKTAYTYEIIDILKFGRTSGLTYVLDLLPQDQKGAFSKNLS